MVRLVPWPSVVLAMCDKCNEIDARAAQYQRLSDAVNDKLVIEQIRKMIDELKAQKAALHPDD